MRGVLFDQHEVELHPDTAHFGGSWQGTDTHGRLIAWDQAALQFFFARCQAYSEPHVLDIGANTGSFALLAAHHEGMRAVAFEPQPDVLAVLAHNIKANNLADRVLPQAFALAHTSGRGKLRVPTARQQSGLACMGKPKRFGAHRDVSVSVTTLDVWSGDRVHVDMMKIDTEGAELQVLLGGEQLIRRCQPEILVEYDARNTAQFGYPHTMIRALLEEWGATCEERGPDLYAHWERP